MEQPVLELLYRLGNLEARLNSGPPRHIAISEYCREGSRLVIATLEPEPDGDVHIRFIGTRPLRPTINWEAFRHLLEVGYQVALRMPSDAGA